MAKNFKTEEMRSILDCARSLLEAEKKLEDEVSSAEKGMSDTVRAVNSGYITLAEVIDSLAPATPLVHIDYTMRQLGKFVETYGNHPHFRDNPVAHFQAALDANADLAAAHEQSGSKREFRTWKQSICQNSAYWAGKTGWTERGREAAKALGLTEGDAIINPTLDPEAIREAEAKKEAKAAASKAKAEYKALPEGQQILADTKAVRNRFVTFGNNVQDAAGLNDVDAETVLVDIQKAAKAIDKLIGEMEKQGAFDGTVKI